MQRPIKRVKQFPPRRPYSAAKYVSKWTDSVSSGAATFAPATDGSIDPTPAFPFAVCLVENSTPL